MIKYKGITISEELEAFLKEHDAYDGFCKGVNKHGGWKEEHTCVLSQITVAFRFHDTDEGFCYWDDMDNIYDGSWE